MVRSFNCDVPNSSKYTIYTGYTTSTSVEDWSVVMEICDKVNLNDSEAKEASRALRKDIQLV